MYYVKGKTIMVGLLLKNWQLVVIAALMVMISVSGLYISRLKSEKRTLVEEKVTLQIELNESHANIAQLTNDIGIQNTAIDKLKTDSDNRQKEHAVELASAKKAALDYKAQAAAILSAKAPQNISDCDAANNLINQGIRNAK
jgi:peptidoglycan hydrolase CwlO-like protein